MTLKMRNCRIWLMSLDKLLKYKILLEEVLVCSRFFSFIIFINTRYYYRHLSRRCFENIFFEKYCLHCHSQLIYFKNNWNKLAQLTIKLYNCRGQILTDRLFNQPGGRRVQSKSAYWKGFMWEKKNKWPKQRCRGVARRVGESGYLPSWASKSAVTGCLTRVTYRVLGYTVTGLGRTIGGMATASWLKIGH